jgi:FkbM family methyltransferase
MLHLSIILIASGLLLFQILATMVCLAYTRRKHRHLFARLDSLADSTSNLADNRLADLEEEVKKWAALHEIEIRKLRRDPTALTPRFVAQYGEDLILFEFFKNEPPGFFIEAGAYDGEFASNTLLLESLGWTGLLVEPHPAMAAHCRELRSKSVVKEAALGPADASGTVVFTCADDSGGGAALSFLESDEDHVERCRQEGCHFNKVEVPFVSLNSLLEPLTQRVNLLSLDVEGMELAVLQGFDLRKYSPSVIVVEVHDDPRDEEVRRYLDGFDYRLAAARACNAFYVKTSEASRFLGILERFPRWRLRSPTVH